MVTANEGMDGEEVGEKYQRRECERLKEARETVKEGTSVHMFSA